MDENLYCIVGMVATTSLAWFHELKYVTKNLDGKITPTELEASDVVKSHTSPIVESNNCSLW